MLQDRILNGGFYDLIERFPASQVTVEVASALEASRERGGRHERWQEKQLHRAAEAIMKFRDRADAGHGLAAKLEPYRQERPIVLALPRGGVPVAFEVAA